MTLLASRGSVQTRMRNALIVILALAVCSLVTISSVTTASRWQTTLEEGNMAGRQQIYREAFAMFLEKPLAGWGPVANYVELGGRLGRRYGRDTHDLFLWLLTELGLVGTVPFCIGLAMCVRAAWKGRKSIHGSLPLALIVATLTVNLANTDYELKFFWVILAYSLASGANLRIRSARWPAPVGGRLQARPTWPRYGGGSASGNLRWGSGKE